MTQIQSATQLVAQRMKQLRGKRGLTAAALAERMTALGIAWDRSIVANLESGRRRSVSLDEVLALALALNVAPVHLIVPPDDYESPYPVTAAITAPNYRVRGWMRGLSVLARLPKVGDKRQFFTEVPPDEFEAVQAGQCPCCGGRRPQQQRYVGGTDGQD